MKPWIAVSLAGHDNSITIYDNGKFYMFEFAKVSGIKHHHFSWKTHPEWYEERKVGEEVYSNMTFKKLWVRKPENPDDHRLKEVCDNEIRINNETVQRVLELAEEQYGIKNDFEYCIYKGTFVNPFTGSHTFALNQYKNFEDLENPMEEYEFYFDTKLIKCDNWVMSKCFHHKAHYYVAAVQSPFDNTYACITVDGGGDDVATVCHVVKNGKYGFAERERFWGHTWLNLNRFTQNFATPNFGVYAKGTQKVYPPPVNLTNSLDFAGKFMGLAAYGEVDEGLYDIFRKAFLYPATTGCPIKPYLLNEELKKHNIGCDPGKSVLMDYIKENKINDADMAATIQKAFEDDFIDFIKEENEKLGLDYHRNLMLCGGVAYNVLLTERIKKELGYNVFVPSVCDDAGLSLGILVHELTEHGLYDVNKKKVDLTFSGFDITDKKKLTQYRKPKNSSVSEIHDMLRKGKVIGLIQGRCETGPRALGRRSILCDPTFPNMKDIVNKIKNREFYRPFAPVCTYESFERYFDSPSKENLESMNFAVEVKPEWREKLKPITHADNTARVQTVRKQNNAWFWNFLRDYDGVLLNTSFNRSGKPTLNSLEDAFWILDNTALDAFVYVNGKNILFWRKDV